MSPDPYEIRRPYYQAELAAGVERFLEPRRNTCPWCGSANLSILLRTADFTQRKPGRFTLEQCGACRHIFQNPRLTAAGLDFYYRDCYDGLGQELMDKVFAAAQRSYQGRAEMLRPFTTPRAWLDVGAGHGHFCNTARSIWPHTIFDGLDQGTSISEAERRGWVGRGYQGSFIELGVELTDRYDVVSMHHYLEHTREPFDELDTAAKILLPGGFLLIEVPDPDFPLSRIFGQFWMPWFQPQHQHMIPLNNLVAAMRDRGFSPVAIQRGEAHQIGHDLTMSLVLALNAYAPDPRLPWLTTPPTRWGKIRRTITWGICWPLLIGMYSLDVLIGHVLRRTRTGNAYRVLARKDG